MRKLLLVSSNTVHTYKYLELIQGYFDEVLVLTNEKSSVYDVPTVELAFHLTIKNLFCTPSKIRKQIVQFNPTLIHIHQANSFAFYTLLANRRLGIPTVLTAWGSDILLLPKQNFLLKAMVKFSLRNADWITSDSSYMTREMETLAKLKNNVLLANFGIDVSRTNTEKLNIVYSNRLHKELYNIPAIVQCFAKFRLKHLNEDWKLVIAGSGADTDKIVQLVNELGLSENVQFVGWINKEENEYWYSVSKIWVSVPNSDATSISLLEAMYCGCIPVVSNLPANLEWIQHNVNGIVVNDFQVEFLSAALELNIENVATRNEQIISEHGTKPANRKKFLELYNQIIGA